MVCKDLEGQKRNKAVLRPRTGSLSWGGGVGTGACTHGFNRSYRRAPNPQAVFRRQGSIIFLSRAGW